MEPDKIQEIIDQAFFESEYDDNENLRELLEKVIELTVEECSEFIGDRVAHRHGYDKYGDVEALFNHFGVK
jgi:hypothetical protein